jgi:hypothetical protein
MAARCDSLSEAEIGDGRRGWNDVVADEVVE